MCCFFRHQNNGEKMDPPILSIIHIMTISTMFKGSEYALEQKTVRVNRP